MKRHWEEGCKREDCANKVAFESLARMVFVLLGSGFCYFCFSSISMFCYILSSCRLPGDSFSQSADFVTLVDLCKAAAYFAVLMSNREEITCHKSIILLFLGLNGTLSF